MGLLDGKVVLITGGARGQGRAHAVRSASAGADVVLLDVDEPVAGVAYGTASGSDMTETVRLVTELGRRAVGVVADVRSQRELDAAVAHGIAELGQIDALIANAGIWTTAPFWEISEDSWQTMIDINLSGVWRAAKAVTPHMIERQAGSIVVISSANGLEPGKDFAHYVSAKHGLIGLMKNIALELAPHGIRCNALNPGAILTPMTDHQGARDRFAGHPGGTQAELLQAGYHYALMKGTTFLAPEVVADAALFLNSDLAAHISGATIPVDAGHLLITGVNQNPVIPD